VEFRPFLTATTSLDGSIATTYQTGAQVVFCDNTLSTALNSADTRVKVRHSANSLTKLATQPRLNSSSAPFMLASLRADKAPIL
jgi:hypothetical protein